MPWPHLMYQGMYKYISLPHIHVSLARWNEYKYFIFHLIQKIKFKPKKYTLIQVYFRMAKMFM